MIKGFIVNRNRKSVKPLAVIAGAENDDGSFKNIVQGYVGKIPVNIKTNLTQYQLERFCEGKLSKKELIRCT
jgi:hypothetical protein